MACRKRWRALSELGVMAQEGGVGAVKVMGHSFGTKLSDLPAGPRVNISIPREESSGFVNNKKENYKFKFRHIFPPDSGLLWPLAVPFLYLPHVAQTNSARQLAIDTFRELGAVGTQDDIFDVVAVPVVDSVLDGYNGTIFAYGQTGSGKTFTITGGAERYTDRGIIPRVLTYLFEQFAKVRRLHYSAGIFLRRTLGWVTNAYSHCDPVRSLPHAAIREVV